MKQNVFEIRDLKCSYNGGATVLDVKHLDLPKGKFIVLIGKSGSGKSTLLETLGLMNHTITGGEVTFLPETDASTAITIHKLWEQKNTEQLSRYRQKYMSFIFQNTNLMPNLTALENICLATMIQGKDFESAKQEALKNMERVGLSMINSSRMAMELSGGQRQRIAFIRAISAQYSVLFGDEPTGNLDEFNTSELMEILRENIRNDGKSVIIVSHNIDVALRFADQIIVISKANSHSCGFIKQECILNGMMADEENRIWQTADGTAINDPKLYIMKTMNE
jgi:ABC-type lipoprotein export system ATPase subunit